MHFLDADDIVRQLGPKGAVELAYEILAAAAEDERGQPDDDTKRCVLCGAPIAKQDEVLPGFPEVCKDCARYQ